MQRSTAVSVCVAVGVLWALRSGLELASPDASNPVSAVDWLVVLLTSVALASLAPGALALGTLAEPTTWFRTAGGAIAVSGILAAVGNLLDNALQVRSGTLIWALGASGLFAALIALTFALLAEQPRTLARVPPLTIAGIATVPVGGGLLVLAAWGWLAMECAREVADRTGRAAGGRGEA
jgi:hypothetical protein